MKKNQFSFSAWLTGLSASIYNRCCESTQKHIRATGQLVLFTAIVSATMVAFAAIHFFDLPDYTIPMIWLVWAAFILMFDRMVIMAGQELKTALIRVIAVFIFASFHAFLLSAIKFDADIQKHLAAKRQDKTEDLVKRTDERQADLSKQIQGWEAHASQLRQQEGAKLEQFATVNTEIGRTPEADRNPLYGQRADLNKQISKLKADYKAAIKNRDSLRIVATNLTAYTKTALADLGKKPTHPSILESLHAIEEMTIEENDWVLTLFLGLMFGLFGIVEALPMISKGSRRFASYYRLEEAVEEVEEQKEIKKIKEQHIHSDIDSIENEIVNSSKTYDVGQDI